MIEPTESDRHLVDAWNRRYDTGIIVNVRLDDGTYIRTVTRSGAWLLGGHTPVIMLRSIPGGHRFSGCYALERVSEIPRPTEEDEERLDYERADGGAACSVCGKCLRDHPDDLDHAGYDGKPFLVRLCDRRLVKL